MAAYNQVWLTLAPLNKVYFMAEYSLKLDENWDLCLDDFGNIATTKEDDAICQDVACSLRLFAQEAYFDPQKGVPYFDIALGQKPFESLLRSELTRAAKSVSGVIDAAITGYETNQDRQLSLRMECLVKGGNIKHLELTNIPTKRGTN